MAATKSEDIRLQMNNVKHKKGDGTLYLMAERLGWMPNTKDNFTISIKYADIKMQKISPEGKPKIQLQIVLHNADNITFQFNNLEDRTAVKDALLLILPQFKGKIPKDREKKAILLSKNPHLLQLYKDLVETKVISAEEFWSQFVGNDGGNDEESGGEPREPQPECQEVGVSANFLSGISFNGKQVKGNVSVETLYAILKTYPKVAKKHQELVPVKMSETEFWNKFFQSRYFNRDRTKDIFTDCVKSDEKEWSSTMKKGILDPFLNVDMFSDNAYSGTAVEEPPHSSSNENPDQLLIKRFNQHSIRVLESLYNKHKTSSSNQQQSRETASGATADDLATTGDSSSLKRVNESLSQKEDCSGGGQVRLAGATEEIEFSSTFRANRRDWTYNDLAGHENNGHFLDEQHKVNSKIHQVDREKYTIVPHGQQQLNSATFREHMESLRAWEPNLGECISPKDATESLKNLSPGGYLMRSTNSNRLEDTVPQDLQKRLKSVYFASNELLRHFWLCFPAVEPSLESKLVKLHETLKKFEMSKLQSFHDSLSRDQRHLLNHLMRGQFKTAYRKFESWKSKKRQRDSLRSSAKCSK